MSVTASASSKNIPTFIANMPPSPRKLHKGRQDAAKLEVETKATKANHSTVKSATSAPIPSMILQESAEEERRASEAATRPISVPSHISTPSAHVPTIVTECKPQGGMVQTPTLSASADPSSASGKAPVYVQVMLQIPGSSTLIPINIPAQVILPSLTSAVATAVSAASMPIVKQPPVDQTLVQPQHVITEAPKPAPVRRLDDTVGDTASPAKILRLSEPSASGTSGSNVVMQRSASYSVPRQTSTVEVFNRSISAKSESETDEDSRNQHLLSNRTAATRCRQKKKQQVENMEKKAKELEEQNKILEDEMAYLKEDILRLERLLKEHEDCLNPADSNIYYAYT